MKKIIVVMLAVCAVSSTFAFHHHHHHHHYRAGDAWAAAGVGLAAGAIGAALYNATKPDTVVVQQPAPVVVQQPVMVQQPAPVVVQQPTQVVVQQPVQNVWVEGRYVPQAQPNGTVMQVWQPGHYEQR